MTMTMGRESKFIFIYAYHGVT